LNDSLRVDAVRLRRTFAGAISAACLCFAAHPAAAADKAAAACIQSAENGETARKAGQLLHARELFAQCAAHECPAVLRHDCASWLEDSDRQIPSIVLGAHDARGADVVDARVSVDGTLVREHLDGNAIALDPGSHVVRFETVGAPPVDVRVVLRAGEKDRAVLATVGPPAPTPAAASSPPPAPAPAERPTPAAPSRSVPAGAWVLGGMTVAAFGVFGYFGVTGANEASNLRSTCAPGCADAQVHATRLKLVAADIGLGVGVVSLVSATWIGVRALTRPRTEAWDIVVAPASSAARADFTIRF
jgi:hypothetical protein